MKLIYLFSFTLLALTQNPKEYSLSPKKSDSNYCTSAVPSITNNGSGGTVTYVKLNGCGSSVNNLMNLTSGTVLLNNGPTCGYRTIFIKVTGTFGSINLVTGSVVVQSQQYDPTNISGRYDFDITECSWVDIEVN